MPEPTALVAALVTSGLPTSRFVSEGFLPRTGKPRRDRLAELATERRTIVVYESPHRRPGRWPISPLRSALTATSASRELTKLHETIVRAPLGEVEIRGARRVRPRDRRSRRAVASAGRRCDTAAIRERRNGASTRDARPRWLSASALPSAVPTPRTCRPRRARASSCEASTVWRRHPDARNELLVSIVDEPPPSADAPGPYAAGARQRLSANGRRRPERSLLRPRPHPDLGLFGLHPRHGRAFGGARADPPVRARRRRLAVQLRGSTDRTTDDVRARILAAVKGMRVDDLVALNARVLPKLLAKILPEARRLLDLHRHAGRNTYIVSAAPVEIVEPLAQSLGMTAGIGIHSAIVDGVYSGGHTGPLVYGAGKVAAMQEIARWDGLDLGQCYAYSDSASDLPMLEAVGHPSPSIRTGGWRGTPATMPGRSCTSASARSR